LPSARTEKFAVKRGKQPGFHFGSVPQLVAFGRPNAKGLLCEITGVSFVPRETEGKLVKRLVITSHQRLKLHGLSHIATLKLRARRTSIVPLRFVGTNSAVIHLINKCPSRFRQKSFFADAMMAAAESMIRRQRTSGAGRNSHLWPENMRAR